MATSAAEPAIQLRPDVVNKRPGAIRIRRARASDYPAIEVFIREAYEDLAAFKAKDRWNWQFVNNPYVQSNDESVPVWIAEDCDKVIGQVAVQEGELRIDGTTHRAGWIVDVMVLPSYRGLGLGYKLYAAAAKDLPILVTLTMAPATRRISEKLGAINLGQVKLFSRWVRLDCHTVERYLRVRTANHPLINSLVRNQCRLFGIHRVMASGGNLLLRLRDSFAAMPRTRGTSQIVEIFRFGPEIDTLWRQVTADFPASFNRESKFLNWRFCDCPQLKYRCFTASKNGSLVGYIVLRETEPVELPQGIIVDLLAARTDRETLEDLVAFALRFFSNRVATVECATSILQYASILRRFGFYTVRRERPNGVVAAGSVRQRLERSSRDWLFSKADHDWDQIHLA